MTILSRFIQERRVFLGLTQVGLSEATGLSTGTIASIESGYSQAPKAKTLEILAEGLKVPYQELDGLLRGVNCGWQPIETAPKDGTRMLLFMDGKQYCGEYFDGDWIMGHLETQGSVQSLKLLERPTHWQPLPPPPEA